MLNGLRRVRWTDAFAQDVHTIAEPMFWDLKLNDIPQTVARAIAACPKSARIISVSAAAGLPTMFAALGSKRTYHQSVRA